MQRRRFAWALAVSLTATSLLRPAAATARPAPRRTALEELAQASVAAIPQGYGRAGHRDTGWELPRTYALGQDGHETIMFTAEGSVYRKKVEDSSHLPRRLSEIIGRTFADNSSSASLNPNLACQGCPNTDTRVEVQDTEETPWDAIGLLARQDANSITSGISQCSGALIGVQRQHVLTAGHCLVDSTTSSDNVDKITFYPGLSGNDLPFGTLTATKARVLRQYVEERSTTPLALNYDFALITLSNAAPVGTTYLDIAAGQGTQRFELTSAGYPADKTGQHMWAVNCSNVEFDFTNGPNELGCGDQCANIVVHDCLSYEGQSGSAIWSTVGENRTIRAILTGALQESDGTTYNVGTQLNSFVYNTVVGWYNEDVTDGLTLAPPAPPGSSQPAFNNGFTETLGSSSWWRRHWWWIALPVGVVLLLALGSIITACLRRGCCGGAKRSRPIVGATYPPAYGHGYPNQAQNYGTDVPQWPASGNTAAQTHGAPTAPASAPTYGSATPQQAAGWTPNPSAATNYERYGPSFYNGYGTSGSPWPAESAPTGYTR